MSVKVVKKMQRINVVNVKLKIDMQVLDVQICKSQMCRYFSWQAQQKCRIYLR